MRNASFLIAVLPVFGILGMAQDDAQYQTWMKSVPPAVAAIRNAPDNAAAAGDAAKAIASGTGDKADNLQKLQGACGGCHSAHREGAAPNFKNQIDQIEEKHNWRFGH
jgi:mono/diheme cytochrome c family protein